MVHDLQVLGWPGLMCEVTTCSLCGIIVQNNNYESVIISKKYTVYELITDS